ncbi:MAG: CpaF family protein, partial [Clostridia bacterium]|nr:CpaF family protein [Clostridia bacterium]
TELEDIIQRIVASAGKEVNVANPIVDSRLPGGERVNVVLPPASIDTPVVTIRRFPKERITMETLVQNGTLTRGAAEFLKGLVRAKYNIFISGGTSSGKTTFLNALSDSIPKEERIITIEDSAELQLTGIPNLVRMETRAANTAGSGEITIRDLIRTSLRMRPERIIVGEVRGEEALDMLGAMNTGHDGSLSTGHANSCEDMLRRLETMVMQGSSGLPLPAVRRNIASSIDLIVHLGRLSAKRRVVLEITEVTGLQDEEIVLNRLYEQRDGELVPTGNSLQHTWKQEVYGHEKNRRSAEGRPEEPDPGDPYFFF